LETVELQSDSHTAVTGTPDDPIEDVAGFWRPGHADEMAVMRRFLDDRFTEGYQVYLLNVTSPEARPLIVDADFTHSRLKWSSDGQQLLVQRFALADLDGSPEIWLYDMQTGDLQLIAEDAIGADFLP
jgi:dipeptidyl aminopeptidase/acylaminoacyl peptidase